MATPACFFRKKGSKGLYKSFHDGLALFWPTTDLSRTRRRKYVFMVKRNANSPAKIKKVMLRAYLMFPLHISSRRPAQ